MSRCSSSHWRRVTLAAALGLALGACGSDEPRGETAGPGAQVDAAGAEPVPEPEPELPERMPVEGLEPDGRTAPWAVAAQIGATLHALTRACGQHDPAQLRQMQDEQRQATAGQGVDMARYDAIWTWAYRHAEKKIAGQSPDELEGGCARLIEMEQESRRMGEMMRQMALP